MRMKTESLDKVRLLRNFVPGNGKHLIRTNEPKLQGNFSEQIVKNLGIAFPKTTAKGRIIIIVTFTIIVQ